jgi:hypothetical protein
VALWVQVDRQIALLGGDLEDSNDVAIGWKAVLSSERIPSGSADLFKVPHHGSPNADNAEIWKAKLIERPIAVLAPFSSASRPLPSEADQKRIASRSEAFCTASSRGTKVRMHDRTVLRKVESTPLRIRQVTGRQIGHVRVRRPLSEAVPPSVELFAGAFKLSAA